METLAQGEPTPRERVLFFFFAFEIAIIVFLQKIAMPGLPVDVSLPLLALGLMLLLATGIGTISPTRVLMLSIFLAAATLSQILAGRGVSAPSILLLFVLYTALIFRMDLSWRAYLRNLNLYQNAMLIGGIIVIIQDIWQFTIGWQSFPNMEHLVPSALLTPGYIYIQPLSYGSAYIKPSGFFFREVSFVSQFTAIAFVIELAFFRRAWRLVLYTAVLFACFAGTGLLLLALITPILLLRSPPRAALLLVALAVTALAAAFAFGWFGYVGQRLGEIQSSTSSTSGRFVVPFQQMMDFIRQGGPVLWGKGAGNMPATETYVWLPITKLVLEYGVVATIAFYAMFLHALFDRGADLMLGAALFVLFNLMGGYLQVAVIVNLCILLGTMFRPSGPKPSAVMMRRLVRGPWRATSDSAQTSTRPTPA